MFETLKLNFIHLGHIQGEIVGALSTEINTHYYSHRWPIDEQWHVLAFCWRYNYKWNPDVLGAIPFTEGQKFEGIAIDLVKVRELTPEEHSQARYKQIVDFWQEKSKTVTRVSDNTRPEPKGSHTWARTRSIYSKRCRIHCRRDWSNWDHFADRGGISDDRQILYSRLDSLLYGLTELTRQKEQAKARRN